MAEAPAGTVTFLFTDIEGSARLWDEHPQEMRAALARHEALLREAIRAHEGYVFKTVGDAFCVVFSRATDALEAALEAQRTLQAEPWAIGPLKVRMALHTGEAEERAGDYFGPPLNRCSRMLTAGHGGQVLLSQASAHIVREALPSGAELKPLGEHRLRDLAQPEDLFQLLHPDLPSEFPPLRSLAAFTHNLPVQLTSFIGRENELAQVKELLAATRLLTLTGVGGCGKTRLALQAAADMVDQHPDGVWLVEQAALADPNLVAQTVAMTLGLRMQADRAALEALTHYLRSKRCLLVLDNCEHLLLTCAEMGDALLRACPSLRILASSREGLGIAGETTYHVPSLSLPPPGAPVSVRSLAPFESIRLFVERAHGYQPTFTLATANAAAVADICHRLDGIPLAIELAAARVRAMPVEDIARRLSDSFRLLTGGSRTALPRQQTLRALVDWSHDLLTGKERVLLRRLSVFAGGWTLEAAEAVCSGDGIEEDEVLDLLTSLVDRSMVLFGSHDEEGRYRLLETVRQYARDRLVESSEVRSVRDRHRSYFAVLGESEARSGKVLRPQWVRRMEREHDNLRAALEWALETEDGSEWALRLAWGAGALWFTCSYFAEGRQRLQAVLARSASAPDELRLGALHAAAHLECHHGDIKLASALAQEALAVARRLDDGVWATRALCVLAWIAISEGSLDRADTYLEEALVLVRELGARWLSTHPVALQGEVARLRGHLDEAQALFAEAWAVDVEEGGWSFAVCRLAQLAEQRGDHTETIRLYRVALASQAEVGDRERSAWCLGGLGRAFGAEGRGERAVRLMAAADALRDAVGLPYDPESRAAWARVRIAEMGEEAFSAACAQGQAMSLEEAVREAMRNEAAETL